MEPAEDNTNELQLSFKCTECPRGSSCSGNAKDQQIQGLDLVDGLVREGIVRVWLGNNTEGVMVRSLDGYYPAADGSNLKFFECETGGCKAAVCDKQRNNCNDLCKESFTGMKW